MAYPYHYLFAFGGTLLGGSEIWTNTIRFVATGTPDEDYDQAERAEGLTTVMAEGFALTGAATLGYSSNVRLEWGKFNAIGPDGKYASESDTYVFDLPSNGVVGSVGASNYIPQVSLAVSWGTDRARGPASKGRIYIPMPGFMPGTNGRLAAAQTQAIASAWAAQIDRLNDEVQGTGQELPIACVVSGVNGAFSPITNVRVGDVLDTQRSRRNALTESYSTAAVPDTP